MRLVDEHLLVGVQGDRVLVALVREPDFDQLARLMPGTEHLDCPVLFNAYLGQGRPLDVQAAAAGLDPALLRAMEARRVRRRAGWPEYVVVDTVDQSAIAQALHASAGAILAPAERVRVDSTGEAIVLVGQAAAMALPPSLALLPLASTYELH